MKATPLLLAFAIGCSKTVAPPEAKQFQPEKHKFDVQPVVEAPEVVVNAEGEKIIHADPSVLFKGTELDHGSVRVDDGVSSPVGAGEAGGR